MRWLPLVLLVVVGCAEAGPPKQVSAPLPKSPSQATSDGALNQSPPPAGSKSESSFSAKGAAARKIIYVAEVDLAVEDFAPIPAEIEALAKRLGGYVSRSKISGSPGVNRAGSWTLRVPAERYVECLIGARALGEVRSASSNSQDVTEEFCDLEARLRNKRQEEDRMLKLLATATGRLEEVLTVEREVSRVRGEIEQMEGRKRVLSESVDLCTVNVSVQEIRAHVPEEAPTYLTRVRRAFNASLSALISVATEFSIFLVVLAPWLAVLLPVLLVVLVWRRWRR